MIGWIGELFFGWRRSFDDDEETGGAVSLFFVRFLKGSNRDGLCGIIAFGRANIKRERT